MQEVLLQLMTGSAFRPKRPATTAAVREQEGPSAALHELMESCWHQVAPGVKASSGYATAIYALCNMREHRLALNDALHDLVEQH